MGIDGGMVVRKIEIEQKIEWKNVERHRHLHPPPEAVPLDSSNTPQLKSRIHFFPRNNKKSQGVGSIVRGGGSRGSSLMLDADSGIQEK